MSKLRTPLLNVKLSTAEAADHLAKELGGKPSYWSIWLANDRKPGRVNRRLPQEPGPGRPRYSAMMVEAFIVAYKVDHPEAGPVPVRVRVPGLSKNRKLVPHISAMTLADGADPAAVLFVIPKPLTTFMLSATEARQIAARLLKAADEIDVEVNE